MLPTSDFDANGMSEQRLAPYKAHYLYWILFHYTVSGSVFWNNKNDMKQGAYIARYNITTAKTVGASNIVDESPIEILKP